MLGKRIMQACHTYGEAARAAAARNAWAPRLGLASAVRPQHAEHYATIAATVSARLQDLGITDVTADAKMASNDDGGASRCDELVLIEQDLHQTATLYEAIVSIIQRANPFVDALERRIDEVQPHLDAGQDALLRYYMDSPDSTSSCFPRSLMLSVACVLTLALVVFAFVL